MTIDSELVDVLIHQSCCKWRNGNFTTNLPSHSIDSCVACIPGHLLNITELACLQLVRLRFVAVLRELYNTSMVKRLSLEKALARCT
jgi:hypothetical protein